MASTCIRFLMTTLACLDCSQLVYLGSLNTVTAVLQLWCTVRYFLQFRGEWFLRNDHTVIIYLLDYVQYSNVVCVLYLDPEPKKNKAVDLYSPHSKYLVTMSLASVVCCLLLFWMPLYIIKFCVSDRFASRWTGVSNESQSLYLWYVRMKVGKYKWTVGLCVHCRHSVSGKMWPLYCGDTTLGWGHIKRRDGCEVLYPSFSQQARNSSIGILRSSMLVNYQTFLP